MNISRFHERSRVESVALYLNSGKRLVLADHRHFRRQADFRSMPHTLLNHPTNGTTYFGEILEKKWRGTLLLGAPIVLRTGRHNERGGFGAAHIWGKHASEMADRGYTALDDVPKYVADIVCPGSPIYCEFAEIGRPPRLTVIRTIHGFAALEYQSRDGGVYSVVTAYAKKNASGTLIGTVRAYGSSVNSSSVSLA